MKMYHPCSAKSRLTLVKRFIITMFGLICILTLSAIASGQNYQYDHHYSLANNPDFLIDWLVDGENVIIKLQVQTRGWMGVGFSYGSGMQSADIVIVWVDDDGRGQISGRLGPADGNGYPPINPAQYYKLLSSSKNATYTSAVISRPLNPCRENAFAITADTIQLIWALSDVLPPNAQDITKHTNRGTKSVHMLTPQVDGAFQSIVNNPSVSHFDVRLHNIAVPNDTDTYYYCEVFRMPKHKTAYNIAQNMLVDPKNVNVVHHVLMFGCNDNIGEFVGNGGDCFLAKNNPMIQNCVQGLGGWAIGGDPFVYPSNMARKFFVPSMPFIMMQVHYNNPNFTSGIIDNSAFRYYLIDHPRPIYVGAFSIAQPPSPVIQVIPPLTQSFTSYVYCPSQCTSRLPRSINIFSGLLHSHLLGRQMRVRHIRNGVELPPALQDDHYDFNYQNVIMLNQPVTILPGDDLILECVYNSSQRVNATVGGYGTPEEMCTVFMQFFPETEDMTDSSCTSLTDPEALAMLLGARSGSLTNVQIATDVDTQPMIQEENGRNISITDFYNTRVQWTPQMKQKLQDFAQFSPQKANAIPKSLTIEHGIPIERPYVAPDNCPYPY